MRVKNWKRFQHFKDRRPPWIKLYRDILDDLEWHRLSGDSAKRLVMIWLMASENDGNIPTTKQLAFRLRMTEKSTSALLLSLSHWLEQSDITPISTGYQNATPETETETETETEKRKSVRFEKPTAEQITEYAKTINFQLDGQKFWNHYESKGWVVGRSPMKNWKAAVSTWKTNGYSNGGNNGHKRTDGERLKSTGKFAGVAEEIKLQ